MEKSWPDVGTYGSCMDKCGFNMASVFHHFLNPIQNQYERMPLHGSRPTEKGQGETFLSMSASGLAKGIIQPAESPPQYRPLEHRSPWPWRSCSDTSTQRAVWLGRTPHRDPCRWPSTSMQPSSIDPIIMLPSKQNIQVKTISQKLTL